MYIPMALIGFIIGVLNIVGVIVIYDDTVTSVTDGFYAVDGWLMYMVFVQTGVLIGLTIAGLYYDTEMRGK